MYVESNPLLYCGGVVRPCSGFSGVLGYSHIKKNQQAMNAEFWSFLYLSENCILLFSEKKKIMHSYA